MDDIIAAKLRESAKALALHANELLTAARQERWPEYNSLRRQIEMRVKALSELAASIPIQEFGCALKPILAYADLMTVSLFEAAVMCTVFTDYDGTGYYATATQMSSEPVDCRAIRTTGVIPSWTHVAWFNK